MGIQTPTSPAVEKTDEIKKQVVEVTEILTSNVEMIKNRGENFDSMQAKSSTLTRMKKVLCSCCIDDLEMGSDMFRRNSAGAQRRQWWHVVKFKIFIVLAIMFLIGCGISIGH
jgi:hypothetical protein